jgi:hypothetical protein
MSPSRAADQRTHLHHIARCVRYRQAPNRTPHCVQSFAVVRQLLQRSSQSVRGQVCIQNQLCGARIDQNLRAALVIVGGARIRHENGRLPTLASSANVVAPARHTTTFARP